MGSGFMFERRRVLAIYWHAFLCLEVAREYMMMIMMMMIVFNETVSHSLKISNVKIRWLLEEYQCC